MPEKLKLLYDIFKQAINGEREAQKMYQDAIALCEDNTTIQTLEKLLKDEMRHEEKLIEQYNKLKSELQVAED